MCQIFRHVERFRKQELIIGHYPVGTATAVHSAEPKSTQEKKEGIQLRVLSRFRVFLSQ
jgi:hypothetical protein